MRRSLSPLLILAAFGLVSAQAAISVGLTGSGVLTFDAAPAVTEWATAVGLPGASGTFITTADLDVAVQGLSATSFTDALPLACVTNPAPSVNLRATYNTSGRYLLLRSGGVAASVLLATLRNDTGVNSSSLTVSYTLRAVNPPLVTIGEEVPGLRVFVSLTGAPGSWQLIPELSGGFPGPLWARVPLFVSWGPGQSLYLLWADDNSSANADNIGLDEGAYAIDDFSASFGDIVVDPFSGVTVFTPSSGQSYAEGNPIEILAFTTPGIGAVTNVLFYDGTNLLGRVAVPPLPARFICTNLSPGLHVLTAVAINSGVALTSAVVTVTVIPYRPRLTIADLGFFLAELSWPEPSAGFELQSTADLRTGMWAPVSEADVPSDGFHRVSVDTFSGARFFRLEKR